MEEKIVLYRHRWHCSPDSPTRKFRCSPERVWGDRKKAKPKLTLWPSCWQLWWASSFSFPGPQDPWAPHQWPLPQRNVPGTLTPKAAVKSGSLLLGPSWDSLQPRTHHMPTMGQRETNEVPSVWFWKPSSFISEKTGLIINHLHCLPCCWYTASS